MKSYTDLKQSKQLAKFLPLESADMYFDGHGRLPQGYAYTLIYPNTFNYDRPCWSLAALLEVLPYPSLHKTFMGWRCDSYNKEGTSCSLGEPSDNPIDACYEMIVKLHEQNIL